MKSTQKNVRQRVQEIASLKLLGALWTDIRQHAEQAGWKVSERQLRRYLAEAEEVIAENVEKDRDRLMAHHFAARRALYARAMAVSDYATARQILKDEAELLGLYPNKKLELGGKDGGPVVLNVCEEVIGRGPPAALGHVIEEVVTHDANSRGTVSQNPPAPGAASVPQE